MKFYKTITLMILCIMYTATAFGSEKRTTLPGDSEDTATIIGDLYPEVGGDVADLIKEFKEKKTR